MVSSNRSSVGLQQKELLGQKRIQTAWFAEKRDTDKLKTVQRLVEQRLHLLEMNMLRERPPLNCNNGKGEIPPR